MNVVIKLPEASTSALVEHMLKSLLPNARVETRVVASFTNRSKGEARATAKQVKRLIGVLRDGGYLIEADRLETDAANHFRPLFTRGWRIDGEPARNGAYVDWTKSPDFHGRHYVRLHEPRDGMYLDISGGNIGNHTRPECTRYSNVFTTSSAARAMARKIASGKLERTILPKETAHFGAHIYTKA